MQASAQMTPLPTWPSLYMGMPQQRWPSPDNTLAPPPISRRSGPPEQLSRRDSSSSTGSTVTMSRSDVPNDEAAATQIEYGPAAAGYGMHGPAGTSLLNAPAASSDHMKSLLSRYERSIRQQALESNREVSVVQDNRGTTSQSDGQNAQEPIQHGVSRGPTVPRNSSRRVSARRGSKQSVRTLSGCIQKKRASTPKGQEYQLLRLAGVRRRKGGAMEFKVVWVPTWVMLGDLRGQSAFDEAKDLAEGKFGRDAWEKEAHASGHLEALDMDSEVEYAPE